MNKTALLFCMLILVVPLFSQEEISTHSAPQLGILDVVSSSFDEAQTNMFTDILRTEIFQMEYFQVVERGMIQQILNEQQISMSGMTDDSQLIEIGHLLSVEKLLIMKVDAFGESIVMNLRVIDVNTSLLDYSQNVLLEEEKQIYNSIKDLVIQLQLYYLEGDHLLSPEEKEQIIKENWRALGAEEEDIDYLIQNMLQPSDFLKIRQYDITFSIKDFISTLEEGWKLDTLKLFFRENIPFDEIQIALGYGITEVDHYVNSFKNHGYSFEEYLDAYKNHILSPEDYGEYQEGYDKDKVILGIGGVANSLPVATAEFSFVILKAGWEHYITDYQRDLQKFSLEMGTFLMNAIMPSPYMQMNYYLGKHPFYVKASAGILAEIFIGGHYGVYGQLGLELDGTFEFHLMATFAGTQPLVSYTDLTTKQGEAGYAGIDFPYMGAFLVYKLSPKNF